MSTRDKVVTLYKYHFSKGKHGNGNVSLYFLITGYIIKIIKVILLLYNMVTYHNHMGLQTSRNVRQQKIIDAMS